jgi:paraquat-inducible protein B
MCDYSKGKIYSIRSHLTDDVYIGSTTDTLPKRLFNHKRYYKRWLNTKKNRCTSFKIIEKDPECYIELVENYPCNSKNELERREGELIRTTTCVNKNIAGRTQKEYREEHRTEIREHLKQYYESNKIEINERHKEYHHNNKQQINERKKQFYESNKQILLEKAKQIYETNKQQLAERMKQYYNNNKQQILEQLKQKYTCECGSTVRKDGKLRHEKTTKHQNFIITSS